MFRPIDDVGKQRGEPAIAKIRTGVARYLRKNPNWSERRLWSTRAGDPSPDMLIGTEIHKLNL